LEVKAETVYPTEVKSVRNQLLYLKTDTEQCNSYSPCCCWFRSGGTVTVRVAALSGLASPWFLFLWFLFS